MINLSKNVIIKSVITKIDRQIDKDTQYQPFRVVITKINTTIKKVRVNPPTISETEPTL